ncbi:MAG: ribulose-phosphate 3-epimerase [Patescibacteria group bacterium]|jgi:ribulose-phosphate 3-epimerase|nr:ribulose-phosphate 3-epimerase [Patescibacteria group bacterium]
MKIYPALLSDSREEIQQQVNRVLAEAPDIETVQVDIIDGRFADNLTVTPADLTGISWADLTIDFHLMTEEPLDYVYELIDYKEELPIRAVIAQIERMSNISHFLEDVQKNGLLPGVSIDLHTPLDELEADHLRFIKIIQLMGIEAGFQGQDFNPIVLNKITQLVKACQTLEIELVIDGGISEKTISSVAAAGATGVAVGSALWNSSSISDTIDTLQQLSQN